LFFLLLIGTDWMTSKTRKLATAETLRRKAFRWFVAIVIISSPLIALKAQESPQVRQTGEFYAAIKQAAEIAMLKTEQFEVSGQTLLPGNILSTKHLIFSSGGNLTISDAAAQSGQVYILANQITLRGSAIITWARHDTNDVPPDRNRAPDGAWGRSDGNNGTDGAPGQQGNIGYPGRSGPSVYLFAKALSGGTLFVDLRGEPGGRGGRGQDGGRGGDGAKGTSSSQSVVDCKSGPGPGGNGGNGGDGGPGGTGGPGGAGGDFSVVGLSLDQATRIQFSAAGGPGGKPGLAGQGGVPGLGGPEGEAHLPFCRPSRRAGNDGIPGKTTQEVAPDGPKGAPGRFVSVPLSDNLSAAIFGD
jgi:hypothetical protein